MYCSAVIFICLFNNLLRTKGVGKHHVEENQFRVANLGGCITWVNVYLYNQSRLFKRTEPLLKTQKIAVGLKSKQSHTLFMFLPI